MGMKPQLWTIQGNDSYDSEKRYNKSDSYEERQRNNIQTVKSE